MNKMNPGCELQDICKTRYAALIQNETRDRGLNEFDDNIDAQTIAKMHAATARLARIRGLLAKCKTMSEVVQICEMIGGAIHAYDRAGDRPVESEGASDSMDVDGLTAAMKRTALTDDGPEDAARTRRKKWASIEPKK